MPLPPRARSLPQRPGGRHPARARPPRRAPRPRRLPQQPHRQDPRGACQLPGALRARAHQSHSVVRGAAGVQRLRRGAAAGSAGHVGAGSSLGTEGQP
uniref:Uncharacterized protein n=1 Tax=Arundo donax TaxID=35708 RepID=A0A0A9DK52_ARUDO